MAKRIRQHSSSSAYRQRRFLYPVLCLSFFLNKSKVQIYIGFLTITYNNHKLVFKLYTMELLNQHYHSTSLKSNFQSSNPITQHQILAQHNSYSASYQSLLTFTCIPRLRIVGHSVNLIVYTSPYQINTHIIHQPTIISFHNMIASFIQSFYTFNHINLGYSTFCPTSTHLHSTLLINYSSINLN